MGKIKQLENGKYEIDFIKRIGDKRMHITKRGFDSIEQAEKAIPLLIEKKISKMKKNHKYGAFAVFFNQYLEYKSQRIGGSTTIGIQSLYNVLLSSYDEVEVSEVLGIHNIINLYRKIVERDDVGEKWKNRAISELRQIIDYAYLRKLIDQETVSDDKTILEKVSIIKKSKEKEYYTPEQIKKFLSVIEKEDDRDLFTVFAYLGTRISEFIALTWDCFDEKNKTIEIKQQLLYLKKGKPVLTDRLKTKESYRICKLNQKVYEILLKRKKRCSIGYIFSKKSTTPYEAITKTTLRRKMVKYMKMAHLPIISPHGFRHSKATQFMSVCRNMEEVKAAAKFMGHSVTMMMETYAHSEKKTIDVLIKRMND